MLEPELADNGHACAADVDVLALRAEGRGPLEEGDVWFLGSGQWGEEKEGSECGAGDARTDYEDVEGWHCE